MNTEVHFLQTFFPHHTTLQCAVNTQNFHNLPEYLEEVYLSQTSLYLRQM